MKPRSLAAKIIKPLSKESWQIPKMDGPGPGTYDIATSIKNAQWGAVKGPIKQSEALQCFTEKHSKLYKFIPGSGHYQNVNNHERVLQKDRQLARTHV